MVFLFVRAMKLECALETIKKRRKENTTRETKKLRNRERAFHY